MLFDQTISCSPKGLLLPCYICIEKKSQYINQPVSCRSTWIFNGCKFLMEHWYTCMGGNWIQLFLSPLLERGKEFVLEEQIFSFYSQNYRKAKRQSQKLFPLKKWHKFNHVYPLLLKQFFLVLRLIQCQEKACYHAVNAADHYDIEVSKKSCVFENHGTQQIF